MGAWGTNLYSDDQTMDFKDDYIIHLKKTQSHELAYKQLYEQFIKDFGTNDNAAEAIFWFVVADVQHKYGKLLTEVKDKANEFFKRNEHLELWEDQGVKLLNKRKLVLKELEEKINSPLPKEKKIPKPIISPHNIGDVFAIKINDFKNRPNPYDEEYSKYYDEFNGKYFILQITGKNKEIDGDIYPYIRIFYWCDYFLPDLKDIKHLPIMPSTDSNGGWFLNIDGKVDNPYLFNKERDDFGIKYLFCNEKSLKKYYIGNLNCTEFNSYSGIIANISTLQRDFYVGYSQLKSINYKP